MNAKNKIIFFLISFTIFQLSAFSAQALCVGISLTNVPGTASFQGSGNSYNVYDTSEYMQTVNFQVTGTASVLTCNYFVVLSPGGSGNSNQRTMSGSTTLRYNAYIAANKANILKDFSSATASNIITGSFQTSLQTQVNNHSFYWTIDKQQVVRAGNYSDNTLTVTLYNGTFGGINSQSDTATISFQGAVASSVDLSLVPSGGSFDPSDNNETLNFSPLTTAAQKNFDLIIRSNDGYSISLQSTNSQKLRHSTYPTVSDLINYSLTFNGGSVNLSGGGAVTVASSSGTTTSASGTSFPSSLTIGTVSSNQTAGSYSDYISVNVSAH
jgi:hypothetical protein